MKKIIFTLFLFLVFPKIPAWAYYTAHPVSLYEKAESMVKVYRGQEVILANSKKIFSELIERYPSSPLGYLGMSHVAVIESCRCANHYDMRLIHEQALPYAVKALELGPALPSVQDQYAVIEEILADYHRRQKKSQEMILVKPDDPQTYFDVANLMLDQGEIEKAVNYFNLSLDMNPPDILRFKIVQRLGWLALYTFRQPEKAVEYYQAGLAIWQDSLVINGYIGIAYYQLGRYDLAVEHLAKADKIVFNDRVREYLFSAQGKIFMQNGREDAAIEKFEAALQHGEGSSLHRLLGNLYWKRNNYPRAQRHFQRVVDTEPQDPDGYYYVARSLYSLGKYAAALEYYARYLRIAAQKDQADNLSAILSLSSGVETGGE